MHRSFLCSALTAAFLAGCSSSPSDSDVKQVVEDMLGRCPYLSLASFKKVNGMAVGDNLHAVDVLFAVQVAPVPGAKEIVERSKVDAMALDEKLAAATEAKVQAYSKDQEYETQKAQALQSKDAALSESLLREQIKLGEEIKEYERKVDSLERQKRALYSATVDPITARVNRECANVHNTIGVYENGKLDQYVTSFTRDFARTLRLVKTDNGWRAAL
jgi:hypothetical protein